MGEGSARWLHRLGTLSTLLALSCGGGAGGCGGCGSSGYQFPDGDPMRPDAVLQSDAVRVRVTQDFLDFIRPQLPTVIRAALGNQPGFSVDANDILRVPLPRARLFDIGVAEAEVSGGEALIWLGDLDQRIDLQFETPNQVRLVMRDLRLGLDARLRGELVGSDFSCPITGDLGTPPQRHAAEITIEATIDPGVGPRPMQLLDIQVQLGRLRLDDLDLRVLGSNVYCQEPECRDCLLEIAGACLDPGGRCAECSVACGGITATAVNLITGLLDLLRPILNQLLTPVVQGLIGDTLRDLNGQPAAFEGQLDLADLVGFDFLQGEPIGVYAGPRSGRFPVVDRNGLGMELTFNAGAEGPLADCVRGLPDFRPLRGPVPELNGADSQNRPYHVGATLAASFFDQILYAVHRSGSLCLQLSTEDVRELTGGAFTLNASLLSLLATDLSELAADAAPVIVELKPRQPGNIELGSGAQTGTDMMGNPVYDWLVKLGLQELGVAFHVLVEDRYVRVFEVSSDIFVGFNVVVQPDNTLQLALGELRIDGFRETYNELLPNADFAQILPALLDLALGALLNQSLTFDVDISTAVSDALGGAPIGLRVNDIFRDGAMQDYLTMSLTFTSSPAASRFGVHTEAMLAPEPGLLTEAKRPTGRIRLAVGDGLPYDVRNDLEYQVRVDGGLWSVPRPARPDGTLFVPQDRLRIPGYHQVEVRARTKDDYMTLDLSPERIEVAVDPNPPSLSARWTQDGLLVRATDAETPEDLLFTFSARLDGLDAGRTQGRELLVTFDEILGRRLEVTATDPAGNQSAPLVVEAPEAPEDVPATTLEATDGCAAAAPGSALPLALLLLGLVAWRRRR